MGPIQSEEFDASQFPPEYVTVELDERIQSILERVEEGWVRSPNVVLVIPRGAQAFHTTHDFLALGKLPGARDVRVSIASPDPTIAGLARVLGFFIEDVPPDHPALAHDPTLGLPSDDDIEKPTAPLPLGAPIGSWGRESEWVLTESHEASPIPRRDSLSTSTWLSEPEDFEPLAVGASRLAAQAPKLKAQGRSPTGPTSSEPLSQPLETGQLSSTSLSSEALEEESVGHPLIRIPPVSPTPSGRIKARSALAPDETRIVEPRLRYGGDIEKSFKWGRFFAIIFVILAGVVAGSAFYAFNYLPEATISIAPLDANPNDIGVELSVVIGGTTGGNPFITGNSPQSSLVAFNLAPGGTQRSALNTTITATLITAPLSEEGTRPASGTRQVPRGTATGTMRFTNQTASAVFIAAGTQFKGPGGVTVKVTQGGTVRATDFVGQSFGTLDLPIAATVEGPGGNIGEGQIAGTYVGKLSYYNLPLQGGSMETQKVVTQEDIDALVNQLQQQVSARRDGAITELAQSVQGQVLITQTRQLANVVSTVDQKAGDVADAVHATVKAEARAYVYNESDVREAVKGVAGTYVRNRYAPIFAPKLDPNSVQYGPLVQQSLTGDTAVYTTTAGGHVTFTLTTELISRIREMARGKGVKELRDLIDSTYRDYVTLLSIDARVLWFNIDKLPNDLARITVQRSNVPGAYLQGGGPQNSGSGKP